MAHIYMFIDKREWLPIVKCQEIDTLASEGGSLCSQKLHMGSFNEKSRKNMDSSHRYSDYHFGIELHICT